MSSITSAQSSMPSPAISSQTYLFLIPTATSSSSPSSLSVGAIVGIVIGGILFGILVAIALGCFLWRFRARANNRLTTPGRVFEVKRGSPVDLRCNNGFGVG